MTQRLTLTDEQRKQIEEVVGHDLTEKKVLSGSPAVTLTLTDEQQKVVLAETGKNVKTLELKEQDLKTLSIAAAYENGVAANIV